MKQRVHRHSVQAVCTMSSSSEGQAGLSLIYPPNRLSCVIILQESTRISNDPFKAHVHVFLFLQENLDPQGDGEPTAPASSLNTLNKLKKESVS